MKKVIDACLISKNIGIEILNMLKFRDGIEQIILFDTLRKDIDNVSDDLNKIMLKIKDEESARVLSEIINEKWKETVKSYVIPTKKCYLVEIISVKTDKGKAIEKVLKMENIADNDVYTIGDGVNDVEMILKYNGYGMKNSEEVIYKVTSKFCNTVSELIENIK